MTQQIRIIILEKNEFLTTTVRRIEKGWIVRFLRGSSLLGHNVSVITSLSGEKSLQWSAGDDHLSVFCQLEATRAGSFKYSFTIDEQNEPSGSGYFLVMPSLSLSGVPLSLDGIVCQTYLTKLLGDFSSWENRIRVAKECAYNMIHLTPIHKLGISNSSYSIADHHAVIDSLHSESSQYGFDDIRSLVSKLEKEGILTVQDVVWNHAAKNAEWLTQHPECAYNCFNSPHLRPAYVMDRIYHHFGKEVGEGKWESRGLPVCIDNIHHVNSMEYILRTEVLTKARLHEFFQIDLERVTDEFKSQASRGVTSDPLDESLTIIPDPLWRRFGCTVDIPTALRIFNRFHHDAVSEEDRLWKCIGAFRHRLEELNAEGGKYAWDVAMAGLAAVVGHVTYERVADHGPRKGKITEDAPLTVDYFLHLTDDTAWEEEEKLAYDEKNGSLLMAFNGWTMSCDPLNNFALPSSQVYLRRELICWGDSVKLNYGEKPEDCPYLWQYMKEYTEQCASMFHGLRIDNAHGTPIHVAEYLLLAAREVRPDLYVFAELFTGSEQLDNMFVNRLGISSLIREAQAANDSHEQGRLVYRYGGDSVGAMQQKSIRPAPSSVAHGLFLDQSHDNPTPILTRSVYDLLPTAAMLTMASCAVGSTRGYDELVRHAIDVVHEKRPYASWGKEVNDKSGIIATRRVLNQLHANLASNNYTQVFVDQMNPDVVGVTRHNPDTHDTVVLVSHTAFNKHQLNHGRVHLKHIPIGGVLEEILFEMGLEELSPEWNPEDDSALIGLSNYSSYVREHVPFNESKMCCIHGDTHIELTNFPAGCVIGFKIRLTDAAQQAVTRIHDITKGRNKGLTDVLLTELSALSLQNFHDLLFCCEAEDQQNISRGAYDIPNFGKPVFCGLQGLIPVLDQIRINNDLGHPLCSNLRDGNWLCDYIVARLLDYNGLSKLAPLFEEILAPLVDIPYYLRPTHFESLYGFLYEQSRKALLKKLSSWVSDSSLLRSLTVSSVSFVGYVKHADLSPLPSSLQLEDSHPSSLAAGLPHFATGIWRNWGRDTFIALPGCLLATGRFDDARNIIISFAGSMRHGLIPNLLAEGQGARFNCRDAVWFWLFSIVKYVKYAPNGIDILSQIVKRLYPSDETEYGKDEKEVPLIDVIYDALDRHFAGINYRERNAGSRIDEHMRDDGFNINIWVDRRTGLIHGGNRWNCGTWMDKMGSSEKAGNRGEPATPRDGAAVELQGLAHFVLIALSKWHKEGLIQKSGVSSSDETWSWSDWSDRIGSHFESEFFVSDDCSDEFVNKRGIVKDTVGSTLKYTDYQLRCNFPIALAVSPTILSPEKAWRALDAAKEHLLGPLGIKTLDPSDWAYNGYYNNDDDGTDKKTAKGWNYHQGPEWLWVAGFYLQARLAIGGVLGGRYKEDALHEIQSRLGAYFGHIKTSVWRSLPELTNENGEYCSGSCPAQAWSVGCLLEVCQQLLKH